MDLHCWSHGHSILSVCFHKEQQNLVVTHCRLPPPIKSNRSCNSTTCHWLKETQSTLCVCRITLARFVQFSKCCDWYACNHQLADRQLPYLLYRVFAAMKRKLWGLLCPTEREPYCSVKLSFFLRNLVCMHFILEKWNKKFTAQPHLFYLSKA